MAEIYFITQGCSANYNDTEIMKGLLKKAGHEITDNLHTADLVIFNTCTVKGPTESFFKKKLKELRALKKKIVLAGCIIQAEKDLRKYSDCSLIGTYQVKNIVPLVEETLKGHIVVNVVREHEDKVLLPKVRTNPLIEIVQIASGCTDACYFCKTKQARGNLHSYRLRDIREQIQLALKEGVKEVWLTSQDNGAYGKDIGSNLIELLKEIVNLEGDFKVRIGMANPNHIVQMLDELIWVIKEHPQLFQFLHIPVQSGSNKVLKEMNRSYALEDYIFIYKRLKEELPYLTIATDIICGYPTETKKDFEESLRLIEQYPVDVLNISRFWPRPGTVAAKMKPLKGEEVKERTRAMTKLFENVAKKLNQRWQEWEGEVLIDEYGKEGTFIGRNFAYKPVIIASNVDLFGKKIRARVYETTSHDLRAHLLEELDD